MASQNIFHQCLKAMQGLRHQGIQDKMPWWWGPCVGPIMVVEDILWCHLTNNLLLVITLSADDFSIASIRYIFQQSQHHLGQHCKHPTLKGLLVMSDLNMCLRVTNLHGEQEVSTARVNFYISPEVALEKHPWAIRVTKVLSTYMEEFFISVWLYCKPHLSPLDIEPKAYK